MYFDKILFTEPDLLSQLIVYQNFRGFGQKYPIFCFGEEYMSNRLGVLLLALLSFAVIAYLYSDVFSFFWSEDKKLSESGKLLQQRFSNEEFMSFSGWSLRNIYASDGKLLVIMDFPSPRVAGKILKAPVYSELVRYCPVVDQDSYWDKSFTQPFTLYLANAGKSRARAIARCTRSFDKQMSDRIATTGSVSGSQLVVRPKEGEDPDVLDSAAANGVPSFNQAQEAMHLDKFKELQGYLNERPELVDLYDGGGETLLFSSDTPEEVKILIGYGADPNIKRRNGPTVLGWVSEFGRSYGAVKVLIEAGAEVDQVEVGFARTDKIAKLLLKKGARVSDNSLFKAIVHRSNLDVAEVLYAHGARLDRTTLVSSPLHYMINSVKHRYSGDLEKQLQMFDAAIRFGASIEKRENGLTPLEYVQSQADWDGREEIISMLRAHDTE